MLENAVADKKAIVARDVKAVADKKAIVALNVKTVADKNAAVADKATNIATSHTLAKEVLATLSRAGNETAMTKGTEGNKGSATNQESKAQNVLDVNRFAAELPSPSKVDKARQPKVIVDGNAVKDWGFLDDLEPTTVDALAAFHEYLKSFILSATVVNGTETAFKTNIAATVQAILYWEPGTTTQGQDHFFPGPECDETTGVEPVLYAIMTKICHVQELGHYCIAEQRMLLDDCRERRIDFVVTPVEEYLMAILPAMLGVPIELKSVARTSCDVGKLLLGAQNQVLGHLAKRARFSLDFGGIGEDCKVFGLELTMGSIAVIALKLSGVGTSNVEVSTSRSQRAPLFDEETRTRLLGERCSDVNKCLEDSKERAGMPGGFHLLARALMSAPQQTGAALLIPCPGRRSTFQPHSFFPKAGASPIRVGTCLGS